MDISIKTVEKEIYICPYCETEYKEKKSAEKCASLYEYFKAISQCKPFKWYQVSFDSGRIFNAEPVKKWLFIESIKIDSKYISSNIERCSDIDFHIAPFGTRNYWNSGYTSDDIKFFPEESMDLEEAYEKYGYIPQVSNNCSVWKNTPKNIIDTINNLIKIDRLKQYKDLSKLSKKKLVVLACSTLPIYKDYTLYTGKSDVSYDADAFVDDMSALFDGLYKNENAEEPKHSLAWKLVNENRQK